MPAMARRGYAGATELAGELVRRFDFDYRTAQCGIPTAATRAFGDRTPDGQTLYQFTPASTRFEQTIDKFKDCARFAGNYTDQQIARMIDIVLRVDQATSLQPLITALNSTLKTGD